MKIKLTILFAILVLGETAKSQDVTIFSNATIHTGTGTVIPNGYLVINNGKIVDVGDKLNTLYKNARVVDVSGKHIYPGLFALNNYVGLNEIDAVRATKDYTETGMFNPNVRALVAFNTDSKILPTLSFNGILYTQSVPQGGIISGSSSLFKTQGWNWEDAVVLADDGIHLNWPGEIAPARKPRDEKNNQIKEHLNQLETFFSSCEAYFKLTNPVDINLKYEAMRPVFEGKANLYIHASTVKSIIAAVNFFKENYPSIKLVLVEAGEAWKITDVLKKHNIPVILTNIHRLPRYNHDDVDEPFKSASVLVQAGILTAIGHTGSWEARNIMFNAGTTAAYGLTKEQALQLITYNAAVIVGVQNKAGSLQTGLDASFIVCNGDIFDMKESIVTEAYINGEPVDLKNHQYMLYKKYLDKYKLSE